MEAVLNIIKMGGTAYIVNENNVAPSSPLDLREPRVLPLNAGREFSPLPPMYCAMQGIEKDSKETRCTGCLR